MVYNLLIVARFIEFEISQSLLITGKPLTDGLVSVIINN